MRYPNSLRALFVASIALAFAGLVACGPGGNGDAGAEQAGESEPVVTNAENTEEDFASPPEVEEVTTPNPTSAMSHDRGDSGEDLFQRGFYQEAIERWRAEAETGDGYAAYRLGVEYFDAQHVERNFETAARYQQLAAELGHAAGMFELGAAYEGGLGVERDIAQAASWYLEAARRGFPPAQHNVATMFEDGVGLEQDLVQAYLYYSLAVEQGFRVNFIQDEASGQSVFVDPRATLRERMTPEEIAEAEAAVRDFTLVE